MQRHAVISATADLCVTPAGSTYVLRS